MNDLTILGAAAHFRTPFQEPDIAPFVGRSKSILVVSGGDGGLEIDMHRYVCHMRDACYMPTALGILNTDRDCIIHPAMLEIPFPPTRKAFGRVIDLLGDGRLKIEYPEPMKIMPGPAICMHVVQSGFSGLFLLDTILGALRAAEFLGTDVPILIPAKLDERKRGFLEIAGIGRHRLVEVPQGACVRVEDAFVPSRSFSFETRANLGGKSHMLGGLVEPHDLSRLNQSIRARFGGGRRRRLYLSRNDVPTRHVLNEDMLVSELSRFGFETLLLSRISIEELLIAFSDAEMVVAPMGSGTINVMFSPPGTKVIEIDHPRNDFILHGICRALGHRLRVAQKTSADERDKNSYAHTVADIPLIRQIVAAELQET